MAVSTFDLFSIGIGPSSSHTVGPMRAAYRFRQKLLEQDQTIDRITLELYGSLGHTGKGHGSDLALLLGLEGEKPHLVDTDQTLERINQIKANGKLQLNQAKVIPFNYKKDLIFHRKLTLPEHANGMKFSAFSQENDLLLEKIYYSVGGGFILSSETNTQPLKEMHQQLPYNFQTGTELLALTKKSGLSISQLMLENEKTWQPLAAIQEKLDQLWLTMSACIDKGIRTEGILPGGLKVKRRAPALYRKLAARHESNDPLAAMDWVNLYALAVNEENASGGRVVTAPTNGAAGIIPAVINYYLNFYQPNDPQTVHRFLLASAAIGILYKLNASISGAEVGCQGEIGVACSMAAAGLAEVLGGTPQQVECAAEIGMEHNLGLTCDPVGGLVQVPCIERNAMGAVKAINAARLAMQGNGEHKVSLDKVIKTMRETGADMKTKYKETARGGLAVNIIEC